MLTGIPYSFGRALSKAGDGAGAAQLTTGYTAGTQLSVVGVGALKVKCKAALVGSSTTYFRVMDYTDPADPQPLQSENQTTGVRAAEHTLAASGGFDLLANLGGTVEVIAIETKADGAPAAGDTATADLWGSEKF